MEYLVSIGIIAVGVILLALALKLLKGLVKTAMTALLIALILGGASMAVLYQDYNTIQDGLQNDAALIVTYQNETLAATNITSGGNPGFINPDTIKNNTFQIIVAHEALSDASFDIANRDVSFEEVEEIFAATTFEAISDVLGLNAEERVSLQEEYMSIEEVKRDLALLGATRTASDNTGRFILQGLQEGTVRVEPPLLTTRFVRLAPESVTESALNATEI
jgi:hypothetical protein